MDNRIRVGDKVRIQLQGDVRIFAEVSYIPTGVGDSWIFADDHPKGGIWYIQQFVSIFKHADDQQAARSTTNSPDKK